MPSELKFIIIDHLNVAGENRIENLILIPKPHFISKINTNSFSLTSNSSVRFINVENANLLFNNLIEYMEELTSISLQKEEMVLIKDEFFKENIKGNIKNLEGQSSYNLEVSDKKTYYQKRILRKEVADMNPMKKIF